MTGFQTFSIVRFLLATTFLLCSGLAITLQAQSIPDSGLPRYSSGEYRSGSALTDTGRGWRTYPSETTVIRELAPLPGTVRNPVRTIASHELVPVRLVIERPVTREEIVTETEYTTREVVRTKPVWETETRYREVTERIPREIERTVTQTETVEKPVIETTYEERTVAETVLREYTDYESQRHIVQRPVSQTVYRDEMVAVEKPVQRTFYQPENVTTYRPVTQTQTVYSPALVPVQQPVAPANTAPYLQWRNRGYVIDPATNQQVWQRGGLHWVRPTDTSAACPVPPAYTQALVPQQQTSTAYVPEVTQQLKPVIVNDTERSWETRRVPYTVESTQSSIEVRDVPVTRYKPVTETRVEKIPVERLTYEKHLVTREIPVRETVHDVVTKQEPYSVRVLKEISETATEQVPHKVQRIVQRSSTEQFVRNVLVRVPLDENDQPLVEIDREMTVEVGSGTKIPADNSIIDLDFFRENLASSAKPPIGGSTETSGRTIRIEPELTPVPDRANAATTGNESSRAADSAPSLNPGEGQAPLAGNETATGNAGGLDIKRGIQPTGPSPATPSDATGE